MVNNPQTDKISKYKNFLTSYKTIKAPLKSIIKHDITLNIINEIVLNINKINIHTYHFNKLYCLDTFNKTGHLPEINSTLINMIMKVLCEKKPVKKGSPLSDENQMLNNKLTKFYDDVYSKLITDDETLTYTHLNTVIDYEKVTIMTGIENHIQNNFYIMFSRYINILMDKKGKEKMFAEFFDGDLLKKVVNKYKKITYELKNDILYNENKCVSLYDHIKDKVRNSIFPKNMEKHIIYYLNNDPIQLMEPLIKMSIELENLGEKALNCFPLRTNIIPKYIKIDTTTIVHKLFDKSINKSHYLNGGNLKLFEDYIWSLFFRTEKKIFNQKKNKYLFNHQICTDGIGCSILFIRKDLYKKKGRNNVRSVKKPLNYREVKYINELTPNEKQKYLNYTIAGIDPGKDDLIYATDGTIIIKNNKQKANTFRYSQNQRRKEIKRKKYASIIEYDKDKTTIDDKTIKGYEAELCKINSKSCILANVIQYITLKNKINSILQTYYEQKLYRKLKWNSYINKQKSEAKMINNFRKKFGDKNHVVICMGDWSQNKQMKYKEPTKGKSIRKLFKNAGYDLYLINEYNTSKMNYLTGKKQLKFRKRESKRQRIIYDKLTNSNKLIKLNIELKKPNINKVHGLLRSENVNNNNSKHILVNRDLNASLNIRLKGYNIINNIPLPVHLQKP